MRTISAALQAFLAQQYQTIASCWMVTQKSGTVRRFTDHDVNVVISGWTGGNAIYNGTYAAIDGYSATTITSSDQMDVDQLSVSGPQVSPAPIEADIAAGVWDFAQVVLFQVNWADLTMGPLVLRTGWTGQLSVGRNDFTAELRGLMQAYARTIGRLYLPACDANLGDTRCGIPVSPPVWKQFTAYTATSPTDPTIGSYVSPSVYNGRIFACTGSGGSAMTEPAWNLTIGGTTLDGTVAWTTLQAWSVTGTLTGVNPNYQTLYDTARTEPGPTGGVAITGITNANPGVVSFAKGATAFFTGEGITLSGIVGPALLNQTTIIRGLDTVACTFQLGVNTTDTSVYPPYVSGGTITPAGSSSGYFDNGVITFTGGLNAGISMEVQSYVPGQMTLFQPLPYLPAIGDTYTMHAGCDKSNTTCKARFNNLVNFRGFPFLPGIDKIVQVARSSGG